MNIPFSFWKTASPKRKRIYSAIFMLVLIIATTLLGTLVQLSAQDAKQLTDDLNKIGTDNPTYASRVVAIFLHNFSLTLLMFIPLVGAAIGLFIMFSSGIALRAIFDIQSASAASAQLTNLSTTTIVIALVFAVLTFVLEYVSYIFAMTESVWLFRRLTQRRWGELKTAGILIGITALMLILAAIVETWVISLPL